MPSFLSAHSIFLTLAVFDLVVGLVVYRYYKSVPPVSRESLVAFSVVAIGLLVNGSGLFCRADDVEFFAIFGGIPLAVWLLPEVEKARLSKAA